MGFPFLSYPFERRGVRSPQANFTQIPWWGPYFLGEGGIREGVPLHSIDILKHTQNSIKNWMGPYQRTPKEVARPIRFSGLGVRSVGPVGDFLEKPSGFYGSLFRVWNIVKFKW